MDGGRVSIREHLPLSSRPDDRGTRGTESTVDQDEPLSVRRFTTPRGSGSSVSLDPRHLAER